MAKNVLKIIAIFLIGTVGGIFADQILWPYFIERPLFYQYRLEQQPVYLTEKKEITVQENVALSTAVEKTSKTVVGIKTQTAGAKTLQGSGLIITSDGLMVTLAGLVPQGSKSALFWEGELPAYQILKRDLANNLALAKIDKNNIPTVGFADFGKIKTGERVFLVGTALETGKDGKTSAAGKIVNEGIIKYFDENLIQTNISEELSLQGSPLFNIEGNVVGIILVDETGMVSAIPVTKIKEFVGF